jgi:hypothetical protein
MVLGFDTQTFIVFILWLLLRKLGYTYATKALSCISKALCLVYVVALLLYLFYNFIRGVICILNLRDEASRKPRGPYGLRNLHRKYMFKRLVRTRPFLFYNRVSYLCSYDFLCLRTGHVSIIERLAHRDRVDCQWWHVIRQVCFVLPALCWLVIYLF